MHETREEDASAVPGHARIGDVEECGAIDQRAHARVRFPHEQAAPDGGCAVARPNSRDGAALHVPVLI